MSGHDDTHSGNRFTPRNQRLQDRPAPWSSRPPRRRCSALRTELCLIVSRAVRTSRERRTHF